MSPPEDFRCLFPTPNLKFNLNEGDYILYLPPLCCFVSVRILPPQITMRLSILHSAVIALAGFRAADASVCKPRSLCKRPI